MTYSTTLSNRGQVVIPAPLRELLGLNAGSRIIFEPTEQGTLEIRQGEAIETRLERIRAYAKYKPSRGLTEDEIARAAVQAEGY